MLAAISIHCARKNQSWNTIIKSQLNRQAYPETSSNFNYGSFDTDPDTDSIKIGIAVKQALCIAGRYTTMKNNATYFGSHRLSIMISAMLIFAASAIADTSDHRIRSVDRQRIMQRIGNQDAMAIADPSGQILMARHADKLLIPASTIKIITALAAFHYLGPESRFYTDIYLDGQRNLIVKGHGDPTLTSEAIQAMAGCLADLPEMKARPLKKIMVDGSDFADMIVIPGITDSFEPYDAPNGALCANFNTVNFIKNASGQYQSAEPQTPLLPMVRSRIQSSGLNQGRIVLSAENNAHLKYAGQLIHYFLKRQGVLISGPVELAHQDQNTADQRLIWRHRSASVNQIVLQLMRYSNNFIANQLLLCCGIAAYGAPATLEKGARAVQTFAIANLEIQEITIVEGSGISRHNRISAAGMLTALKAFLPHYQLLRQYSHGYYKTGTLTGITSRAGYITDRSGKLNPFVLMFNSNGRHDAKAVIRLIASAIDR